MVSYSLNHLTQEESQQVMGPIQDDEALLLFSLIRTMRISNVLEVGGLGGYSALNFSRAVGATGKVVTIDLYPVVKVAENHHTIVCNCKNFDPDSIDLNEIGLVFFDAHDYDAQMTLYSNLVLKNKITQNTILALHDTNTHDQKYTPSSYRTDQGFVHQEVERLMVNRFVDMGYHAFCAHTTPISEMGVLKYRHGLTILNKFNRLSV